MGQDATVPMSLHRTTGKRVQGASRRALSPCPHASPHHRTRRDAAEAPEQDCPHVPSPSRVSGTPRSPPSPQYLPAAALGPAPRPYARRPRTRPRARTSPSLPAATPPRATPPALIGRAQPHPSLLLAEPPLRGGAEGRGGVTAQARGRHVVRSGPRVGVPRGVPDHSRLFLNLSKPSPQRSAEPQHPWGHGGAPTREVGTKFGVGEVPAVLRGCGRWSSLSSPPQDPHPPAFPGLWGGSPNLSVDVGAASHSTVLLTLSFPQCPHPPASLGLWEVPLAGWVPQIWGGSPVICP